MDNPDSLGSDDQNVEDQKIEDQKTEDDSPWEISSHSSSGNPSSTNNHRGAVVDYKASTSTHAFEKALTVTPSIPDSGPLSHLEQFHNSINFTIACLYKLPIRHPAPLDRLRQKNFSDTSPYQHFDILYIRDKFPRLNADVSSRLGKMISLRRQMLHIRNTHSKNLELNEPQTENSIIGNHRTLKTKTTMLEVFEPPIKNNLYALSIPESKLSYASTYTEKKLIIDVPPRPKGENGNELDYFVCPYCRVVKKIKTAHQWE